MEQSQCKSTTFSLIILCICKKITIVMLMANITIVLSPSLTGCFYKLVKSKGTLICAGHDTLLMVMFHDPLI